MSEPTPTLRNTMYLMTYRADGRRCLIHPGVDAATQAEFLQLMMFATGYAQGATGVQLHADGWVMTHGHTTLTDPNGLRPKFDTLRNAAIRQGIAELHGLTGSVFSRNGPEETEVLDTFTMVDKMAYLMTQPIHHHLVADRSELDTSPFYRTTPAMLGKTLTIKLPACLTAKFSRTRYPSEVTLRYTPPAGWEGPARRKELLQTLYARSLRHVSRALRTRSEKGIPRPSLARTLAVSPQYTPPREQPDALSDDKPKPGARHFIPRVAGGTRDERKARLNARAIFRAEYRKAWLEFRAGNRDVEFPDGTYKMRRDHNVQIAALAS